MDPKKAAAFVRDQLRDATDEQLATLGSARRKAKWSNARPGYPEDSLKRLWKAVVAAGHEPGAEQKRVAPYVWAGIAKRPLPRQPGPYVYSSIGSVRILEPRTAQTADLEAQGVFMALIAANTLLLKDFEVVVRSWKRAGLALPKGSS